MFPIREYSYFKTINMDGLRKKLTEFNEALSSSGDEKALNKHEWNHEDY